MNCRSKESGRRHPDGRRKPTMDSQERRRSSTMSLSNRESRTGSICGRRRQGGETVVVGALIFGLRFTPCVAPSRRRFQHGAGVAAQIVGECLPLFNRWNVPSLGAEFSGVRRMPVVEHTVELAVGRVVVVQTVGRFLAVFALRPCFLIFEQGDGSTVVVMRRAQIGTRPLLCADAHDSVFVAIDVADDFRIEVGVDLDQSPRSMQCRASSPRSSERVQPRRPLRRG